MRTITFNTYEGTKIPDQKVRYGGRIQQPEDPVLDGYKFTGWKYKGKDWDFFAYTVSEDMTFDAQWQIADLPNYTVWADTYADSLEVFILPRENTLYGNSQVTKIQVIRGSDSSVVAEKNFSEGEALARSYLFKNLIKYDGDVKYKIYVTWIYDANGDGIRESSYTESAYESILYTEYPHTLTTSIVNEKLISELSLKFYDPSDKIESVRVYFYKEGKSVETVLLTGKETVISESGFESYVYKAEFTSEIQTGSNYVVKWEIDCKNYGGFVGADYRTDLIVRSTSVSF